MKYLIYIFLLQALCVNAADNTYSGSNLVSGSLLDVVLNTCEVCRVLQKTAQNLPPIETARAKLFDLCAVIPKQIFDSCDHSASLLIERLYGFLKKFSADDNYCNNYCGKNSRKLNIGTLCDTATTLKSKLGIFVDDVTSDMIKLCHTASNPFACVDGKINKKPALNGILQRIFVRFIEMIAPGNRCDFDMKTIPNSEQLEASMTAKKMERAPMKDDETQPTKLTCSLCDMFIKFLRQVVTKETHVGREIREDIHRSISDTCQKYINEVATGCDTLATLFTDILDNLVDRIQNGVCNETLKCNELEEGEP